MCIYIGLPQWLSGQESTRSVGDTGDVGLIPGLGRSPEEGMATHSSILAAVYPEHRSLMGCSPWSHKELDVTEVTERARTCMCMLRLLCPFTCH